MLMRLAAVTLLALVLAGCGGRAPPPGDATPRLPSRSSATLWTLADVAVNFRPGANLFWFEATYGSADRVEERAATVMRIGLTQAAASVMNGGRHVTLEAVIHSFQGLSAAQVYSTGGHVSVDFDLVARDSVTGEVLAAREHFTMGRRIPGGMVLLIAPGSQRSLITGMVRDEAQRWLDRCCTRS